MKNLITLLTLTLCLVMSSSVLAVVTPTTPITDENTELHENVASKKMTKKQLRQQKKLAKLKKRLEKYQAKRAAKGQEVDFNDDTDKWMWFWIFGWGAGLLLSILAVASVFTITGFGIFWLLASLCWLFGSISLIIWLVKKFT